MEKYFMHRIQKENGQFSKGIEVHDTLDAAVLALWGRMKLAYGKSPAITFVHCKITDASGRAVSIPGGAMGEVYDMVWKAETETENVFFLHRIRLNGETFDKGIDAVAEFNTACGDFAALMEYGYNNEKFPNVSFVHNEITDLMSGGLVLKNGTWAQPEPQPEPEPAE